MLCNSGLFGQNALLCYILTFQVQNSPVALPYTDTGFVVTYYGGVVRYSTTFGLVVDFDGVWKITVTVPADLYSSYMCGVCGNLDGSSVNDYTLENGTYVGGRLDAGKLIGDSFVDINTEETDEYLIVIFIIIVIELYSSCGCYFCQ
jgi:hypothetical protein